MERTPAAQRQATWRAVLRAEHANLRAALGWALEHGETEPALRVGRALWDFWEAPHAADGPTR